MSEKQLNIALQKRATFQLEGFEGTNFHMKNQVLPGISANPADQNTPLGPLARDGSVIEFGDIELEFYVDEDLTNYQQLYQWFLESHISKVPGFEYQYNNTRMGTLFIYSAHYNMNKQVWFYDCVPQSLGGLNFANDTGTMYQTTSLNLKYWYYEFDGNRV